MLIIAASFLLLTLTITISSSMYNSLILEQTIVQNFEKRLETSFLLHTLEQAAPLHLNLQLKLNSKLISLQEQTNLTQLTELDNGKVLLATLNNTDTGVAWLLTGSNVQLLWYQ